MAAAAAIAARWAASAGSAAVSPARRQCSAQARTYGCASTWSSATGCSFPSRASSAQPGQEELVGGRPRPDAEQLQQLAALAPLRLDQLRHRVAVAEPGRERVEVGVRQPAG